MLTLTNLKSHVTHALGGTPATEITSTDIINQAGRHMFSHSWKFRSRPTVEISTVSSQSYVDLPSDVGEIITIRMKDGLNDSIQLTSYDKLLLVRNGSISTGRHFYAAVSYYDSTGVTDTAIAITPRLEIAPTPSAVDRISIFYRVKWPSITEDAEIAPVPDWSESLLIAYVRAFAQGYEEENFMQRVAEVDQSPLFHRTAIQDGMLLPDYGPIEGGHISSYRENGRLPFDTIADPSS